MSDSGGADAIRNSAKAVIVRDGKLLAIECRSWRQETYYILPGGGQLPGETLTGALIRECREEIGADVNPGKLLWVREYIGRNHEFSEKHADTHALEFMFECTLMPGSIPSAGSVPDEYQTGIAWLPLSELDSVKFYPQALKKVLAANSGRDIVYLGDVN